ncbi:trypsin-like peptidase domain-containing protein [Streptomyces cupreus]|uniref:Trypsin-like peptidase domain-containing protein n=1 Tax=Streptomyces cupreus TaxID=2759956 RepID=A0A7X1JA46_9ACTN|nr:trypsin-like peptidase domain-containing protein [Streptomyces cupreus]
MTGTGYWIELFQAQQRLGGGFLITRRYVLTALHCLRGLATLDDRVDVVLADGSRLAGEVCRRDEEADLALIAIAGAYDVRLPIPRAGVAHGGDAWHGPYRPAAAEVHLRGQVDSGAAKYLCEGGAVIQALQLTVHQILGDYSGYSGGPVVKGVPGDHEPVVVGILLEQVPDRVAADRAANVLFAATIGEAMRRFDQFDVEHLLDVIDPAGSTPGQSRRARSVLQRTAKADPAQQEAEERDEPKVATVAAAAAAAESWFERIDEWSGRHILDPAQVAELKFTAAKAAIEGHTRGNSS